MLSIPADNSAEFSQIPLFKLRVENIKGSKIRSSWQGGSPVDLNSK